MTTETKTQRTIKAVIKGKMEKEGARGRYLSVQVLREKMQYPETYNCWDTKQLEYVKLNQLVTLILNRDGVKADKEDDGAVASYWWSIAGVAGENPEDSIEQDSADQQPTQTVGAASPDSFQDAIQYRIQVGMAFNAAVALQAAGQVAGGLLGLRKCRDQLLHDVILVPVAPAHWCYIHETQMVQSKKTGVWGHVLEDGTSCTEQTEYKTWKEKQTKNDRPIS